MSGQTGEQQQQEEQVGGEKDVFKKTGIACDRIRQQAKKCIKESECVQVKRQKARQCMDNRDLPDKCIDFMETLMECRRNMIDPRARFRGRRGDM